MKILHSLAAVSALAFVPGVALAQAAPAASPASPAASAPAPASAGATAGVNLAVGTPVYDPQGGIVGKVDSVAADAVVVDTGNAKAALPKSAFSTGAAGATVTVTKAQIDAQVAAGSEKLQAALVPGAEVRSKEGAPVGTIKEVVGDQVVIDRASGAVSLTRTAFAEGPQGLSIGLTSAELDAAAKQAAPLPR